MKKEQSTHFIQGEDFPFQEADWADSDYDDEVSLAAQKAFGIRFLFPWQRIVIANIVDSVRRDAQGETDATEPEDVVYNGRQIVLLPTGAGKSLCFLTPALLLERPTLIIYPLLALMADQKRRMDEGGIPSVIFRGGQTHEEREENFRRIEAGAKIIIANPEVLQNSALVERLAECHIAHIAIDEAHCVSEWGDSFRPSYLTLGDIIVRLGVKTVTAFTATASPMVLSRVSDVLFGGLAHIIRSDSDRPNIHYKVVHAYAKKRAAFRLSLTEEKPMLIFCGTRGMSEEMARELAAYYGRETVQFYHAGLEKEEKTKVENWFYHKKDAILCCTCAYGMGVDKKDIHTVIHLEAPRNVEAYIQEAGRAARDGSVGNAILLWSFDDEMKWKQYEASSRENVLFRFATATTCRRQILLDALGGEQAVCDGCDVCARKGKPAPFAEDARFVLQFIAQNRKYYTNKAIKSALCTALNERDRTLFKEYIWGQDDIETILAQLKAQGFVSYTSRLWKNRVDCNRKAFEKKNGHLYTHQRGGAKISMKKEGRFRKALTLPLRRLLRVRQV